MDTDASFSWYYRLTLTFLQRPLIKFWTNLCLLNILVAETFITDPSNLHYDIYVSYLFMKSKDIENILIFRLGCLSKLHMPQINIPRVIWNCIQRICIIVYTRFSWCILTLLGSNTWDTWGQGSAFASIDCYNHFEGNKCLKHGKFNCYNWLMFYIIFWRYSTLYLL